jgi:hypothetical protein
MDFILRSECSILSGQTRGTAGQPEASIVTGNKSSPFVFGRSRPELDTATETGTLAELAYSSNCSGFGVSEFGDGNALVKTDKRMDRTELFQRYGRSIESRTLLHESRRFGTVLTLGLAAQVSPVLEHRRVFAYFLTLFLFHPAALFPGHCRLQPIPDAFGKE